MKKTYLYRLFAYSKPAGLAAILFIFVYALLLYKKMDMAIFPFNAMFAYERPLGQSLMGYRLWVNDKPADFTHFPYWKKDMMETSLGVYARYLENGQALYIKSYLDQKKSSWPPLGALEDVLVPNTAGMASWPEWYARKASLAAGQGSNIRIIKYQMAWVSGRPIITDSSIIYQSTKPGK